MKFLATEPWYRNEYHHASPQVPHVFDYPDQEEPNPNWYPLDLKAVEALKRLSEKQGQAKFVPHRMLTGVVTEGCDEIPPAVPHDPSAPPTGLFGGRSKVQAATLAEIQAQSRPSDREPGRTK